MEQELMKTYQLLNQFCKKKKKKKNTLHSKWSSWHIRIQEPAFKITIFCYKMSLLSGMYLKRDSVWLSKTCIWFKRRSMVRFRYQRTLFKHLAFDINLSHSLYHVLFSAQAQAPRVASMGQMTFILNDMPALVNSQAFQTVHVVILLASPSLFEV